MALAMLSGVAAGVGAAALYSPLIGSSGPEMPADVQQLVGRLNVVRTAASCPPLTVDATLSAMAQTRAADMVTRGYLGSVTPDNQDVASLAHQFGYPGEATFSYAAGLSTPAEVITQWTNPKPELAMAITRRIRTCSMTSVGIGHDTGTVFPALAAHVWVMVLGDR
jgi:Cysteine-rich secretory protein family